MVKACAVDVPKNGPYTANRVLSLISVVFNQAIDRGWDGVNPAKGVTKNKEKSRDRFVQGDEMQHFLQAVEEEPSDVMRDFFMMLLFCGQRKSNVCAMRWDEIDFTHCLWRIPDTKNNDPLFVVLTEPALEILQRRKKKRKDSVWVFPSERSESGHLVESKRAWKALLKRAGLENLRLHDLR